LVALTKRFFCLAMLVGLATIGFYAFNQFELPRIWDDGYIFQRYAQQLLAGAGLAWNPGSEPSYGLTSPLFVIPHALFRVLSGGNPSLGAALSSTVFGVVFILLTLWLVARHLEASRAVRAAVALLFVFCLGWSEVGRLLSCGMDTTFALSYLAGLLIVARRFAKDASRRSAALLGIYGGVAFWVRPELITFSLAIAGAEFLYGGERRKVARWALALVVGVIGVILLTNKLYFGTALPLPFYAKSWGLYQGSLDVAYRGVAGQALVEFIGYFWPLILVVILGVVGRSQLRHADPLDKALALATAACLIYYSAVALPVMGGAQRFYMPTIVPLTYLAGRSLSNWQRALPVTIRGLGSERWAAAACAGMLLLLVLLAPKTVAHGKSFAWKLRRRGWHWDPVKHSATRGPNEYWFRVNEFAALPDDLVIAATEVGFLSALNPRKHIIDMAGLNDKRYALEPFDAERLLGEQRPDLIYMPHQDYRAMIEALEGSPHFRRYVHYDNKRLKTRKFGIAIAKESRYYLKMLAVVRRDKRAR